jgi:DNA-binding MarR family transcriptional regulator
MNKLALVGDDRLRNARAVQADAVQQLIERISCGLRDLQNEIQTALSSSNNDLGAALAEAPSFALPVRSAESLETNLQMDVRRARKLRQLRKRMFGKQVFSGPGWEILLQLFDTHISQVRDTVGSVCEGTQLPAATALRWIGRLEQEQLVRLKDDQFDRRRRFVELTNSGVQLMTNYFSGSAPHQITA